MQDITLQQPIPRCPELRQNCYRVDGVTALMATALAALTEMIDSATVIADPVAMNSVIYKIKDGRRQISRSLFWLINPKRNHEDIRG